MSAGRNLKNLTLLHRQVYALEYIWKTARLEWAAVHLRKMFPRATDVATCILEWLVREQGQEDAIEAEIRALVADQHPVDFHDLVFFTSTAKRLRW